MKALAFYLWEGRQVSEVTQAEILEEGGGGGKEPVIVEGDQLALQQRANGAVAAG
jgi:hypothetical protein